MARRGFARTDSSRRVSSSRGPAARRRRGERGIALIMVVIAIALLTVLGTEFAYNTRVELQMATNSRDELRAFYLAKSGIGLSRLLLKFQGQLDGMQLPNLGSLIGQLGGALGGGSSGGSPSTPPSTMSIQLWRMARIDCHMLQGMVREPEPTAEETKIGNSRLSSDEDFPEVGEEQSQRSFGSFTGCFLSQISDEEEKINVQRLNATGADARSTFTVLTNLLADKRFEFLFEREDSHGVRLQPQEQLIALRDWVDEDESGSAVDAAGVGEPFVKGFADENGPYDRYNPRYKAKNAFFDSLDELYMVHGVNDRFMAAFRDRLTVYPDINSKINVNSDDPIILYMAIIAVSDPIRPDPRLRDPVFVDALIRQIRQARMFSLFGMSGLDFVKLVQAAGVPVNTSILNNFQTANRAISDKSKTFKIKSVGEAGTVQKTLTAVVRIDQGLGKLVYWREE
jgi:general secretion pathway protein K